MATTINDIIDVFKPKMFEARVVNHTPIELLYKKFFPLQYSEDNETEVVSFDVGAKVAGDIIAHDSEIGVKSKRTPSIIKVQIPKVGWGDRLDESDIKKYNRLTGNLMRLQARNSASPGSVPSGQIENVQKQIFDLIYKQGGEAVDGVQSKIELMAKQIASGGEYQLTLVNNAMGVKTKTPITFGLPAENKKNAAVNWGTSATATPLNDLELIKNLAVGYKLNYMTMSEQEYRTLANTAQMREFTASALLLALGKDGTLAPTITQVNGALKDKGFPQIQLWDSSVTVEDKAGAGQAVTGWNEGAILFSETAELGTTRYTDPVDSMVKSEGTVVATNDFVTVKRWATENPPRVTTISVGEATPVLEGVTRKFLLNTKIA